MIMAAFVFEAAEGGAATIQRLPPADETLPIFLVEGELLPGDQYVFQEVISDVPVGIVLLSSPGGSLDAGIEIGKLIRLRGLGTVVIDGTECLSACALAWLGGQPRAMQPNAMIGFHAAYVERNGAKHETGVGNARVGAYLTKLGLNEAAIDFVTRPGPYQMAELTPDRARYLGIMVRVLEPAAAPESPEPRALEDAAVAFVVEHMEAGSRQNAAQARYSAETRYADVVDYYGQKALPREKVVASIAAYIGRYPVRSLQVRGTPTAKCERSVCAVSGVADFAAEATARNVRVSGSVEFTLVLVDAGAGAFRIVSETSEAVRSTTEPIDRRAAETVRRVQEELDRLGCQPGPVDGVWGARSRAALERFNSATGTQLSPHRLSPSTVMTLKAERDGACVKSAFRRHRESMR
ncbi:hypothetical protein DLJ53_17565 [Acuticoccus sediminis]|uniref:Peptidoglycan binding-like domain-containing protein n=1 Tax=Acuticoccus sediminis TaxID=2184697 RepID=A0A8B2NRU5_9HYPH|nr:peptidoglycan-binding protein [Acuticoccus sediminis]RAI01030.1 hypothetical protein DLJ53_17565 [Acuticoccus sediminis]